MVGEVVDRRAVCNKTQHAVVPKEDLTFVQCMKSGLDSPSGSVHTVRLLMFVTVTSPLPAV